MISKELKEELKTLSKEVFGSSSRYQKILDRGMLQPLTEEVTEYVPGETDEDEGFTRQVQVPVKRNGMDVSVTKRPTPEELKQIMLDMKAKREAFLEQLKKMQEEAKTKKALEEHQKQVAKELEGSAV